MASWTQQGFAVVSEVASKEPTPYFHSFHRPEHDAHDALVNLALRLPNNLTTGIRIVPAKLIIEIEGKMTKPIHEELADIGGSAPAGAWDALQTEQVREHIDALVGDGLTGRKAASICQDRRFKVSGVVLQNKVGERCIVELSAVRWMSKEDMWALMHPDH